MEIQVQKLRAALPLLKLAVPMATRQVQQTGGGVDSVLVSNGYITANNREQAISIALSEIGENDRFCIPFRRTQELLANLNGQDMLTITRVAASNSIEMRLPNGFTGRLVVGDPDLFPKLTNVPKANSQQGDLDGDLLLRKLTEMSPYVNKNIKADARTSISGVYMKVRGQTVLAATDGSRMAYQTINTGLPLVDGASDLILPPSYIRMLATAWKNTTHEIKQNGTIAGTLKRPGTELAQIGIAKRYIHLHWNKVRVASTWGDITLSCVFPEGNFPDFTAIMMDQVDHNFVVDAQDLFRGLGQIRSMNENSASPVRLTWEEGGEMVSLTGGSVDKGEVSTTVKARVSSPAGGRIAFNLGYLQDFLKGKEGQVLFECTSDKHPARWTATRGPVYQVAPVSVNWDPTSSDNNPGAEAG